MTTWRRRAALRALARELRAHDPALASLLSERRRYLLPPLRFRSVPAWGYAVCGAALLLSGITLDLVSAIVWGLVSLVAAVVRHSLKPAARPSSAPPGRRDQAV
jgi:hypothetical protein